MTTINSSSRAVRRLGAVAIVVSIAGAATGAIAFAGEATPPPTGPETPPIAVEEWTRVDEDTLVRGNFIDSTGASLRFTHAGRAEVVVELADLSHVAVARFTIRPGAQFPWHSHPGPVLVTVTQGELVYVMSDDCSEHSYAAGTAFLDPGRGNVHSAYNPTDGETVIVATFLEMTAEGPLSLTDGITGPADNCGLSAAAAHH
jgi:quercetin dioxygenase-like cupin family protein